MVMRTCAVQRVVPPPQTPSAGPQRCAHTAALARADDTIPPVQSQTQAWNSLLPTAEYFEAAGQSTGELWRLRSSASDNAEPDLLTACAWEILLRGAENPTEFGRTDRRQRSRTRYAQHRAAQPPCAAEEMHLHRTAMYKHRKGKSMDAIKLLKRGMSLYPSNCFFATSIGSIYSKQRKYQQAEEYLQQALDVNPNSSVVLNALAGVKAKKGHVDEARELFERAVKADPQNAQALQAWAVLEKRQRNPKKAISLLESCLKTCPYHEPAMHALAVIEIEQRHFTRARKLLQQALLVNPSHAHSWTTLGELCYIQGDPSQARSIFKRTISNCGADSVLYATWAAMEAKISDYGKAVKLLELALELDDSNAHAHLQLITILARDGSFQQRAPQEMQKAMQKFPNNVHIKHLCASFLLECGQDDAADALLSTLAEMQPSNGLVATTQGLLHMKRGEREAAAACFKRGMDDTAANNALLCHEELAKLAVLEGRPEVARDVFQYGAGKCQPTSRFLREWGLFERKIGNIEKARALFQQSVELRAMDVRSWVAWALLERSQQDYTQALEVLRQGISIAPKVTTLWFLYCETALKVLPLGKCRAIFEEAHKCIPRSPQTHLLEATMEWKHGDVRRARTAFRRGGKCAHGPNATYSPLFQAWAQFEEAQGNSDEAASRMQQYLAAESAEHRRTSDSTPDVEALVDSLGLQPVHSPLPESTLAPQPV